LTPEPEKRATAAQLLDHPFLRLACDVKYVPPLLKLAKELADKEEFEDF
jgi:p21-activated kinase 1